MDPVTSGLSVLEENPFLDFLPRDVLLWDRFKSLVQVFQWAPMVYTAWTYQESHFKPKQTLTKGWELILECQTMSNIVKRNFIGLGNLRT